MNSSHAEDLIESASKNAVVAVASPLACPVLVEAREISAYVEKMGYYLGGGADS